MGDGQECLARTRAAARARLSEISLTMRQRARKWLPVLIAAPSSSRQRFGTPLVLRHFPRQTAVFSIIRPDWEDYGKMQRAYSSPASMICGGLGVMSIGCGVW